MVVPGDAPFVTSSVLIQLVQHHREAEPAASVLTTLLRDPGSYGRIVRNGYRQIKRIVESRDANLEELKIKEINSGIYCFNTQEMLPLLSSLSRNNKGGEYYLTDVVKLLNKRGLRVEAMRARHGRADGAHDGVDPFRGDWRILGRKREA